jgi:23S rRNA pseudouridine1911/1915/1917 synthase
VELIVLAENVNERIDKYITERVELTRSAVCILIENGDITLNDKIVNKNYKVREGDRINIVLPEPKKLEITAENIPLDICYEDEFLLVVNKPQGMVVHPAAGNYEKTLVNALMAHCGDSLSGINGVIRPGIIHRIDKDTSGLLIVAKTNNAHLKLAEQIKAHSFLRVYNGIVYGHLKDEAGVVDAPIGRHPSDRKKMAVTERNSKHAVTHYKVLENYPKHSLVEFTLETGRTHQIRVHMAYLGHAILGDPVYGPKNADKMGLNGQCLHAKKIGFIHPETDKYLEFDSELPEYFLKVIDKLKK